MILQESPYIYNYATLGSGGLSDYFDVVESTSDTDTIHIDSTTTDLHVQIAVDYQPTQGFVYLCYVDSNNWVRALLNTGSQLLVSTKVSGTETVVYTSNAGVSTGEEVLISCKIVGDQLTFRGGEAGSTITIPASLVGTSTVRTRFPYDGTLKYIAMVAADSANSLSGEIDLTGATDFPLLSGADNIKPKITVTGEPETYIRLGETVPTFTATATDNEDGDLSASITVTGTNADNSTAGSYVTYYNVSDAAGNPADEVTRTVIVLAENEYPPSGLRVIGIGDSIGNHTFNTKQPFYDVAASLNCSAYMINHAEGGSFAFRMDQQLADHLADGRDTSNTLFIIMNGTNSEKDADGNAFPSYFDSYDIYMHRIIARIHNEGYKVAISTKTRSASDNNNEGDVSVVTRQINLSRDLTPQYHDSETDRPLLDYYTLSKGKHSEGWFIDNFHPSETGETAIQEYAAAQLVPTIEDVFIKDSGLLVTIDDHKTVSKGQSVSVSANATDTNGNAMSYTWTQIYGPIVQMTGNYSDTLTFDAPNLDRQLIFRVSVSNGYDTDFRDVIVDVGDSLNPAMYDPELGDTIPPVVTNNGPSTLTLTVGDTYTPDFSTNEGTLNISNPVDTSTAGTYTVTATATDAAGNVGSETQTVIVTEEANVPPTANAGPDQSVAAGELVQVSASGSSDGDGTIVTWLWEELTNSGVVLQDANTDTVSFVAPEQSYSQNIRLQLTVTDNDGLSDNDSVTVTVAAKQTGGGGSVSVSSYRHGVYVTEVPTRRKFN